MARTREYQHFCPVARSLEVIGEKWSLLVVRDLLRGPQRFTDLLRGLGGITPKWLTLRLRDLEQAGIVEADREVGRREVWYRLTARGRDLAPVVESLAVWGIDHARRPPLPGEPINPENSLAAMVTYRNRRGLRLTRPAAWLVRFAGGPDMRVIWDGARWSYARGAGDAAPDVTVETDAETWVRFLMAGSSAARQAEVIRMQLSGAAAAVAELVRSFGVRGGSPAE